MIVLHAHWQLANEDEPAAMTFWAEEATAPTYPTAAEGKKTPLHPFAATSQAVGEILRSVGFHTLPPHTANWLGLQLPSSDQGPQPSPQLLHNWELTPPDEIITWMIQVINVDPVDAFPLLINLPSAENLPPAITLGTDLRFWKRAARFLLEALAQQKILPSMTVTQTGDMYARWQPLLDDVEDGPRLAQLLKAMPPLCRAEAVIETPSPGTLLDAFFDVTTDGLVRKWNKNDVIAQNFINSPGMRWADALTDPGEGRVYGATAPLRHLSMNYAQWQQSLHAAGNATARVAFRLEAPTQQPDAADAQQWQLHFLLQSKEDPSLLVPAQEVWAAEGPVTVLNRRFEQPQTQLLQGLGYAARLYEPLQAGLNEAQPNGLALTTAQAFDFLRHGAPLLEASGFEVLVPPWWNKATAHLGAKLELSPEQAISPGFTTFENLVRYQWKLSLGETTLSKEEFESLVALKSPLVQIRGQWVRLDPEQVDAAIEFWRKQDLTGDMTLQEAARAGLGGEEEVNGLPIEEVSYKGWLKEWREKLTNEVALEPLPPPEGLQAMLRPYQAYGYAWLDFLRQWGMGACLADDMGLGKTLQAIALLLKQQERQPDIIAPSLVVCPTSVVVNWAKEIERFAPSLSVMVHQGGDRLRDQEFVDAAQQTNVTLTSYALVRRDAAALKAVQWQTVILDEAQNIKNPNTKQARAVRQLSAPFRIALTGTPVENRLSELWSIMQFLNPGYLGSQQAFRKTFALPIERYGNEEATQRLKQLTGPFILRRIKTDPTVIQDLPDKQEMKVYCHLSEEQATLYEAVVQNTMQAIEESEGIQRKGLVLAMLMNLKQICNHPAQYLHQIGDGATVAVENAAARSGKLARLTEMLEEAISVGDRVLIFSQFTTIGRLLQHHLQTQLGVGTLFLHGGTPAKNRMTMVERFQEDSDAPPIFILSLKAGGTGLNLTRANHVFHFDRWWNPAVEDQATDRAFRIGQEKNVQVHKFICVGTLEERIDQTIEHKKALAESVIGGGEGWLTELSTDDLRELVTLRGKVIKE